MKVFLIKLVAFMALCIGVISILNFLLVDDIHSYTRIMMSEMYAQENIDIVFIGSSRVYWTFDTETADEILDMNTFNAGSSSQMLDGSYYLLKEIIKTNAPQTVLLEVSLSDADYSSEREVATHLIADYMRWSKDRFEYFNEAMDGKGILSYVFPIYSSHSRISLDIPTFLTILKQKLTDGYDYGNYRYVTYKNAEYRGKGFVYSFSEYQDGGEVKVYKENEIVGDMSRDYLDRIVSLCRENAIELILFTAPYAPPYFERIVNYDLYDSYFQKYAEQNGLIYMDFNYLNNDTFKSTDFFKDSRHINGIGAEEFTRIFCTIYSAIKANPDLYDTLFLLPDASVE